LHAEKARPHTRESPWTFFEKMTSKMPLNRHIALILHRLISLDVVN
jgi:hypothetical protein